LNAPLLVHLVYAACVADAESVLAGFLEMPTVSGSDPIAVQAPAIIALAELDPRCIRTPSVAAWRSRIQDAVSALAIRPPRPPADHARPGLSGPDCEACRHLDAFLRDPRRAEAAFPLAEAKRRHLEEVIGVWECDVRTRVQRQGRPYSLVCTKTTRGHEREVARHGEAKRLLVRLAALDG
jgi:hypothetical protein